MSTSSQGKVQENESKSCCGTARSRRPHSSSSTEPHHLGEAQRLVSPGHGPQKASSRTPPEQLMVALAALGCVCLVGWIVLAAVGWAIAGNAPRPLQSPHLNSVTALHPHAAFAVVSLGGGGGPYEDDMSGYLLRVLGTEGVSGGSVERSGGEDGGDLSHPWVALDGGAALGGLRAAAQNGVFSDVQISPEDNWMSLDRYVMQKLVAHHLIGHTHLDHVLGTVISTAEITFQGSNRTLWGLDFVTEDLSNSVFNNVLWPALQNFPGSGLFLKTLPVRTPFSLEGTGMQVTAFPLAHGDVNSSAFLLRASSSSNLLYLSDVMPDACHWNAKTKTCDVATVNKELWAAVAPLVRAGSLKAVMMEASYPSSRPDNILFGHLTPCYVLQELRVLASLACDSSTSSSPCLQGLTVFITHIKAWWLSKAASTEGLTPRSVIERELKGSGTLHGTPGPNNTVSGCPAQTNDLGVEFVFVDRGFQYNV